MRRISPASAIERGDRVQVGVTSHEIRPRVRDWDRVMPGLMLGLGAMFALAVAITVVILQLSADRPVAPDTASSSDSRHVPSNPAAITPADPDQLKPVSPTDAKILNAAIPLTKLPVPSATSLTVMTGDALSFSRSIDCLTTAIYYEAATEPIDGQRAVAQVVLNRVRHPSFPHSVCGVIYQGYERPTGCQFSFTCDGSLARKPQPRLWQQARAVAVSALTGAVYAPVGWSTHYHADYVLPYWATTMTKLAVIGHHIFYRLPSVGGAPGAFSARYAGQESDAAALLAAAAIAARMPNAVPTASPGTAAPTSRPVLLPGSGDTESNGRIFFAARPTGPVVPTSQRWIIGGARAPENQSAIPVPHEPATPSREVRLVHQDAEPNRPKGD